LQSLSICQNDIFNFFFRLDYRASVLISELSPLRHSTVRDLLPYGASRRLCCCKIRQHTVRASPFMCQHGLVRRQVHYIAVEGHQMSSPVLFDKVSELLSF